MRKILYFLSAIFITTVIISGISSATEIPSPGTLEIWDGSIAESYAGGSGVKDDPYLISNGAELALLMQEINTTVNEYEQNTKDKYYKLTRDIYLNDLTDFELWSDTYSPKNIWTPGGMVTSKYTCVGFAGYFDGDGFDVKGIYVNRNEQYNGLFGYIFNGSIKDVGVTHSYISGRQYTAGLAGYARAFTSNVSVSGISVSDCKILGTSQAGGVLGNAETSSGYTLTISKCRAKADISAKYNYAGGILASAASYGPFYNKTAAKKYAISITDCESQCSLSAGTGVGGILGTTKDQISSKGKLTGILVQRCSADVRIECTSKYGVIVGALAPYNDRQDLECEAVLKSCYGKGVVYTRSLETGEVYGYCNITLTAEDTAILDDESFSDKESFKGFDFENVWLMTETNPTLKRLGDILLDGRVSASGIVDFLGIFSGKNTKSLDNATADFTSDGEITLSDLNAYLSYLKAKGASTNVSANALRVAVSQTKTTSGFTVGVYNPKSFFVESPSGTLTSKIELGDLVATLGDEDGKISRKDIDGNIFMKGYVYDVDTPPSFAGYSELESFDAQTGILRIKDSDKTFTVNESTPVSFAEKSTEVFRRLSSDYINTKNKNYYQDDNTKNPLRIFLCTDGEDSDGNVRVAFAIIVRD